MRSDHLLRCRTNQRRACRAKGAGCCQACLDDHHNPQLHRLHREARARDVLPEVVSRDVRDGAYDEPEGWRCLCEGDHDDGCRWADETAPLNHHEPRHSAALQGDDAERDGQRAGRSPVPAEAPDEHGTERDA